MEESRDDADQQQQEDGTVYAVRPVRVREQGLQHAPAGHRDVQDEPADERQPARRHQRVAAVRLPPRLDPRRRAPRLGTHPQPGDGLCDPLGAEQVRVRVDGHAAVDDVERDAVNAVAAGERVPMQGGFLVAVEALYAEIQLFADGVLLVAGGRSRRSLPS